MLRYTTNRNDFSRYRKNIIPFFNHVHVCQCSPFIYRITKAYIVRARRLTVVSILLPGNLLPPPHTASLVSAKTTLTATEQSDISGKILRLLYGMAYQVIKQALVWTKQETQLSYEIENRIIAGYLGNTVKLTQLGRGNFTQYRQHRVR